MKKTFDQYLIDQGALNADQKTKDRFWVDFRRIYDRQHKKRSRAKKKKVEIYFLKQDFLELQHNASALGIPISDYARGAIIAAMYGVYILPSSHIIQDIVIALKGVHGELSNIAHVALHKGHVSNQEMEKARQILFNLETQLRTILEPKALDVWLVEQTSQNPEFLPQLEALIQKLKSCEECS